MRAKQLAVLAALEVEKLRKKVFDAQVRQRGSLRGGRRCLPFPQPRSRAIGYFHPRRQDHGSRYCSHVGHAHGGG